ncbi:transglutaminase domain-containing protein, partial [Actinophytocola sp.]|uniref:transglutaminase domain-containing protein n=1 Tax=Actinophytocola sp. TaxID=1872138 RepID=UPI002ED183AC
MPDDSRDILGGLNVAAGSQAVDPRAAVTAAVRASAARGGAAGRTTVPGTVRALADRLGTPERIFNWVRSNVVFEPGWGSVLGADGCFQIRRCDAHDTSSLLLSLLAARNIPARYVTGLVDVDAGVFRSAAGDVASNTAASQIAVVTGWPHETIGGGKIRLAHVWVEADLTGRGAFLPLDAALKPHLFTPPAARAVDATTRAAALADTITFDPATATLTNFDAQAFDARAQDVSDALLAEVGPEPVLRTPDAVRLVGELTGSLRAKVHAVSLSKGAAPLGDIVSIAGRDQTLPDSVRHRLEVSFVAGAGAGAGDGTVTTTIPLDETDDTRLTVDFAAATPTDADEVARYGGLWSTPPGEVALRPTLLMAGEAKLIGAPIAFTAFQQVHTRVLRPNGTVTANVSNFLRAGSVGALVVNPVRVGIGSLTTSSTRVGGLADRFTTPRPGTVTGDELH